MFLYVQETDNKNETWKVRRDSELPEVMDKCAHVSVYAQAEQDREDLDYTKVKLKGDFIIDIDIEPLPKAIAGVNRLLDYLDSILLNLNYLKLYCSGSKGFHVVIPQKTFDTEDRKIAMLNRYHSWMAGYISEQCGTKFDMGLYHNRHLIRIPNKARRDHRYKVPVTVAEVRAMTEADYMSYVAAPRSLVVSHMIDKNYLCTELNNLWCQAKDQVRKQLADRKKYPAIGEHELEAFAPDNVPLCIEWIRDGLNTKGNYNLKSLNIATFIAGAASVNDATKDQLIDDFVTRTDSRSYPTKAERRAHLMAAVKSAEGGSFQFSCGANRSVLSDNPCAGCALQRNREREAEQAHQIVEGEDGYYLADARLTTFTLKRQHQIVSLNEATNTYVYWGDSLLVTEKVTGNDNVSVIEIGSEDWTSMTKFKSAMSRVQNAVCMFPNERALAALQNYLNSTQAVEALLSFETAGISIFHMNGQERRVWPEEGWAMGNSEMTLTLVGEFGGTIMTLRTAATATPGDEQVVQMLHSLLHSNRPEKVAVMVGWAACCHLKEHLFRAGVREFPLLHLAGKPGAGKTHSATVYSALTGANYKGGPIDVGSATPSPLRQAMSQSTTVARVFDEFNKVNMLPNKYLQVLGYLKAAYNRQALPVGYISSNKLGKVNAATAQYYATSPMIYMAREPVEQEELFQRSVLVEISERDHRVDSHDKHFQAVYRGLSGHSLAGSPMQRLVKLLIRKSLDIDTSLVGEWYQTIAESLPLDRHAREVNNIYCLKLGLRFLQHSLEGFPTHILERVAELESLVTQHWVAEEQGIIQKRRRFSTPELIMKSFSIMAELPESHTTYGRLIPGNHYFRYGNQIYLHTALSYAQYRQYTRYCESVPDASSADSVRNILSETPYFLGDAPPPNADRKYGWVCLDLPQIEERGINTSVFKEF